MSQYTTKLETRNQMSARDLVINEHSTIDFVPNPQKNGSLFFTCGSKTGYIAPSLLEKINEAGLNEITYVETRKPGSTEWVPCLLLKRVRRSLGAELLG